VKALLFSMKVYQRYDSGLENSGQDDADSIVEVSNRGLYAPQAADLEVNIELL
jgi:hypothetical protein